MIINNGMEIHREKKSRMETSKSGVGELFSTRATITNFDFQRAVRLAAVEACLLLVPRGPVLHASGRVIGD